MPRRRDYSQYRRAPPWWNPDVPFPPRPGDAAAWRPMRRQFLRRFAIFFILFAVACGAFTFLFWTAALGLGGISIPDRVGLLLRPLGIGAFLFGLLALIFALRLFRSTTEPVGDVMDAAQRVAQGDYTIRVEERGPREVRSLARTFNEMTARLQTNDTERRQLLADVSHELKTPLTVIQGNLEGMLDGVYPLDAAHLEPVLDETRQLARLIEDLRTLALAESGALHLQKESTDLAVLDAETVASFRSQAEAAGVTLSSNASPALPNVEIDPARIRQVIENLIANSLRYTERGGEIQVSATTGTNKHVIVAVKDTGRGIPAEELPHIFERFYKARDSRGTGLGLAIAKSLVEAHGGEIHAESEAGKGTRIWLDLPI